MQAVSTVAAVALLVVYLAWVVPYLRADAAADEAPARRARGPRRPVRRVGRPARARRARRRLRLGLVRRAPSTRRSTSCGISEAFAGIVIVAIAGNAVENVAGIVLARKGQSDLAICVVKNSVAQIAAFLFPALVLISLLFSTA